jgi:hypothetical protein
MVTADKESPLSMGSAFNLLVNCGSPPQLDDSESSPGILGLSRDNNSFKEKTWRSMARDLVSSIIVDKNSATAKTNSQGKQILPLLYPFRRSILRRA